MASSGFALFPTALGECGIAWSERGTLGLQLPEASPREARRRLARRFPEAVEREPPAEIRAVVARVVALLDGGRDDLASVTLDWHDVGEFERRVYEAARAVLPGTTTTYGEIAARVGAAGAARAVGRALGRNPYPIVVPCHRVLAAAGALGGFSARGGVATKLALLDIEQAAEPDGKQRLVSGAAVAPPKRAGDRRVGAPIRSAPRGLVPPDVV